jgi:hypothetical protein
MTRTDKLLIGVILFFASAALLVLYSLSPGGESKSATVRIHGRIVKTLELSGDEERRTFEIEGSIGDSVIQVEGARVRILNSPCPDKICVKQGWVEKPGEVIICVPNEISVSVEGDDGVDAIIR